MIVYVVGISSVDGIRSYNITSPKTLECLDFLSKYDHEGSHINLVVLDMVKDMMGVTQFIGLEKGIYGEDVYKRLEV